MGFNSGLKVLIFGLLVPYRVHDSGLLIHTMLLKPYYSRVVVYLRQNFLNVSLTRIRQPSKKYIQQSGLY